MKCSKCGNEIPSQSRFCLSCGEPVPASRPETPAAPRKRIGLWAALAGLAIAVIIAAIFMASRGKVTQPDPVPNPQQTPVVNAPGLPGVPQPGVLDTDVQKPPVDLKKPDKPEPPADVVAYLEHLKRVEKLRQDTSAKELNDLVAAAPDIIAKAYAFDEEVEDGPNTSDLTARASQYNREWQAVAQYFLRVRPPQSCAVLAGKYYDSLREFVTFMNSFGEAVGKSDLAKLKSIQRDHVDIDQKLMAADQELANVCNTYGIQKSFSIQSETSRTPLVGF